MNEELTEIKIKFLEANISILLNLLQWYEIKNVISNKNASDEIKTIANEQLDKVEQWLSRLISHEELNDGTQRLVFLNTLIDILQSPPAEVFESETNRNAN